LANLVYANLGLANKDNAKPGDANTDNANLGWANIAGQVYQVDFLPVCPGHLSGHKKGRAQGPAIRCTAVVIVYYGIGSPSWYQHGIVHARCSL
jgi:hypothetical protein